MARSFVAGLALLLPIFAVACASEADRRRGGCDRGPARRDVRPDRQDRRRQDDAHPARRRLRRARRAAPLRGEHARAPLRPALSERSDRPLRHEGRVLVDRRADERHRRPPGALRQRRRARRSEPAHRSEARRRARPLLAHREHRLLRSLVAVRRAPRVLRRRSRPRPVAAARTWRVLKDNFARDTNPYVTFNGCNGAAHVAPELLAALAAPGRRARSPARTSRS